MKYIIAINIVGIVIGIVNPTFYADWLSLDVYKILHGQIWRLVTFILDPMYSSSGGSTGASHLMDILWFAIWAYVYYSIGQALEQVWGTFRFTLFMLFGGVFIILVTFVSYFLMRPVFYSGVSASVMSYYMGVQVTLSYLYESLFLAFALLFPDMQFLLYFLIPIKAKWLAVVYLVLDGVTVIQGLLSGQYFMVALILGAVLNVVLFYVFAKGTPGVKGSYHQKKRRVQYKRKVQNATASEAGTIHKCAICGRTEKDAPGMEFRYCSKCNGNYEYCSEHLFTHEHVK